MNTINEMFFLKQEDKPLQELIISKVLTNKKKYFILNYYYMVNVITFIHV